MTAAVKKSCTVSPYAFGAPSPSLEIRTATEIAWRVLVPQPGVPPTPPTMDALIDASSQAAVANSQRFDFNLAQRIRQAFHQGINDATAVYCSSPGVSLRSVEAIDVAAEIAGLNRWAAQASSSFRQAFQFPDDPAGSYQGPERRWNQRVLIDSKNTPIFKVGYQAVSHLADGFPVRDEERNRFIESALAKAGSALHSEELGGLKTLLLPSLRKAYLVGDAARSPHTLAADAGRTREVFESYALRCFHVSLTVLLSQGAGWESLRASQEPSVAVQSEDAFDPASKAAG